MILVACEFSGTVRDALIARGAEAVSCDLLPADGPHIEGDVRDVLDRDWDAVIAFPPCTHLSSSGARWWAQKRADGRQQDAIDFFLSFTVLDCPWAVENPVGIMSREFGKPDQIIQPWQFGHGEVKTTCLWLHRLPPLEPTEVVEGREQRVWKMSPCPDRGLKRSITYRGIAEAMAEQWLPAIYG